MAGKGCHVITANEYLAQRDAEKMTPAYQFLGLTVGCLDDTEPGTPQRRAAYEADITYGTNNEFGFDYLRDNMAWNTDELVQRGHNFAIVDEVDSILIDEARTPLIISGPTQDEVKWYGEFAKIARTMVKDTDYEVDEKKRTISVLEPGITKVEDWLGIDNLYDSVNTPLISFMNNAIKAKELFRNDKEYVVLNGEVLIVDEHTGRMLAGRRYNDGLHQAIEAKEGVTVREEYQTLATVTLQNYFRLYDKLSGMTGTAMTEASEFDKIYKLGVVPIPTNRPMQRVDNVDLVYRTEEAKYDAVADQYIYNWATLKTHAGTCRKFILTLADGTLAGSAASLPGCLRTLRAATSCSLVRTSPSDRAITPEPRRVRVGISACLLGEDAVKSLVRRRRIPAPPMAIATAPAHDPQLDKVMAAEVTSELLAKVVDGGLQIGPPLLGRARKCRVSEVLLVIVAGAAVFVWVPTPSIIGYSKVSSTK